MSDSNAVQQPLVEVAMYLAQGEESLAIQRCDQILDVEPAHAEALCMRGVALRSLGMKHLGMATQAYEAAIQADPTYPKPHFQTIRLAYTLGRLDRCIMRYKARAVEDPADARNYAYLAFSLFIAGDCTKALGVVEKGVACGPTDAYVHFVKGEILRALGDLPMAIGAWEAAVEHDESMVDALYCIAETYETMDELDRAREAWKRLLALLKIKGAPQMQMNEIRSRMDRLGRFSG